MSADPAFPRGATLPIPEDVQVGAGWVEQMVEMADHIGPLETLRLVDAFGGQRPYVSSDPERNPFRSVLSPAAIATVSRVYGGAHLWVPVGRLALARARRAPVIAAVRARQMTLSQAAQLLGTSVSYVSQLANRTGEGVGTRPLVTRAKRGDARQIDMFPDT